MIMPLLLYLFNFIGKKNADDEEQLNVIEFVEIKNIAIEDVKNIDVVVDIAEASVTNSMI
jgi:hypothetical protein